MEQAVQRDVLSAFEYAHNEEEWIYPLADTLKGVSATEAAWTPPTGVPNTRCIWQIVLHMAVWTENIVQRQAQRSRGEEPGEPSEGAWPSLPAVQDENAWADTQERLWNALTAFRTLIETTPPGAMLDEGQVGYSQFADLLCRFTHNAYHIGQITKLREWYAADNKGA